MKKNNLLLGILALMLVITMTAIGCGNDPDKPSGPQWVPATGESAEPLTGTLSANGTTLTFTKWWGKGGEVTFTKSSGSLNGVWITNGERLTISGNTNWILELTVEGPLGSSTSESDYYDFAKGTLTVNGTTITFITTHLMMDNNGGEDGSKTDSGTKPTLVPATGKYARSLSDLG